MKASCASLGWPLSTTSRRRLAGSTCSISWPSTLRKRIELYEAARARYPERWSGDIRNWSLAPIVCLNPEREAVLQQTSKAA